MAVALKNSGGIRDKIGLIYQPPGSDDPSEIEFLPPRANPEIGKIAGSISQLDIEGSLRFNNGIVIVGLTAQELLAIIEHSIAADGVGTVASGRFPQVAGMRFSFDPRATSGDRIQSLAIVAADGTIADRLVVEGELAGDPKRRIKMATMNFLVDGGSGFPFPMPASGRVNPYGASGHDPSHTRSSGGALNDDGGSAIVGPGLADFAEPGTEKDALAEYLAAHFTDQPYAIADTPREMDRRIQNLGIPGVQDFVLIK